MVSASYSDGSIWSSRRTGRTVLTLSFLTRTLREDMAAGGARSAKSQRKIREKKRSSHKSRYAEFGFAQMEMITAPWRPFFDG